MVTQNAIFKREPQRQVSHLTYVSNEIPSGRIYSRYQIMPLHSQGPMTRYKTIEHPLTERGLLQHADIMGVRGAGVGSGGIFSLGYIKSEARDGKMLQHPRFYIKYEVVSIDNPQGHLFPLHLGNRLRFHYLAYYKNSHQANPIYIDSGEMQYEVIRHQWGYTRSKPIVPGDIYVVRFRQSSRNDPRLLVQYDYTFSNALGWYIASKYYIHNRPVVYYHLTSWER